MKTAPLPAQIPAVGTPYLAAPTRYSAVRSDWFRRCGKSGLQLPSLSLGFWHNFGGPEAAAPSSPAEAAFHNNARAMALTAFDHGITHFDLANNYGPPPGSAETRLGRILRDDLSAHRDELIISTKAGYDMWEGPYGNWGSKKYILASLDQSLRRLGLEYVDLFYHHRPDPNTPIDETLAALDQAVRSGKALYAGISNYTGIQAEAVAHSAKEHGTVAPIVDQVRYHMFDRRMETELFPAARALGLGVVAFCPLAQGLLTDKYLTSIPTNSRANSSTGQLNKRSINDESRRKIGLLNDLAQARGQSLAGMALAWALRHPEVASLIIGASTPQQIIDNIQASSQSSFSAEEYASIDAITASP